MGSNHRRPQTRTATLRAPAGQPASPAFLNFSPSASPWPHISESPNAATRTEGVGGAMGSSVVGLLGSLSPGLTMRDRSFDSSSSRHSFLSPSPAVKSLRPAPQIICNLPKMPGETGGLQQSNRAGSTNCCSAARHPAYVRGLSASCLARTTLLAPRYDVDRPLPARRTGGAYLAYGVGHGERVHQRGGGHRGRNRTYSGAKGKSAGTGGRTASAHRCQRASRRRAHADSTLAAR